MRVKTFIAYGCDNAHSPEYHQSRQRPHRYNDIPRDQAPNYSLQDHLGRKRNRQCRDTADFLLRFARLNRNGLELWIREKSRILHRHFDPISFVQRNGAHGMWISLEIECVENEDS